MRHTCCSPETFDGGEWFIGLRPWTLPLSDKKKSSLFDPNPHTDTSLMCPFCALMHPACFGFCKCVYVVHAAHVCNHALQHSLALQRSDKRPQESSLPAISCHCSETVRKTINQHKKKASPLRNKHHHTTCYKERPPIITADTDPPNSHVTHMSPPLPFHLGIRLFCTCSVTERCGNVVHRWWKFFSSENTKNFQLWEGGKCSTKFSSATKPSDGMGW